MHAGKVMAAIPVGGLICFLQCSKHIASFLFHLHVSQVFRSSAVQHQAIARTNSPPFLCHFALRADQEPQDTPKQRNNHLNTKTTKVKR